MTAPLARLWFGAFGGLVAWSAHLVLGYLLISAACLEGESRLGGAAGLNAAFLALTLALGAVAALATAAAARTWSAGRGWRRFMGFFGVLLSGLSLATIVLGGTQPAMLPPCA